MDDTNNVVDLNQVAFAYTYELRPHLDLLLCVLTLEDSWQKHRITAAFKGISDDRDGLFDIIQRSKNHYHKRAYQCIKCLVALFSSCPAAHQILLSNVEFKRKWTAAVDWLHEELDRPYPAGNNQYARLIFYFFKMIFKFFLSFSFRFKYNFDMYFICRYNQWSPPAQSNETSNGYFLERSHRARLTLEKSIELCPDEEVEGEEGALPSSVATSTAVVTDEPESVAPPPPLSSNEDFPALKTHTQQRTVQQQSRPGHAHPAATTPRATAPLNPNPNLSMPRSSPSQFSPLNPSRPPPQQPLMKNDGSSSQSGQ